MPQIIAIAGPTASGKTALSIAMAQALNTEIISCDSMQIYRHMDIGTAKPTLAERQGIVHHMIDIIDPQQPFSVAHYVEQADAIVQRLLAAGKTPILVGGTGLYMDALLQGDRFVGEETDHALRAHYQQMADTQGNQAVHDVLRDMDPAVADRLHPNNSKRVIRAIEVFTKTGQSIDVFNAQNAAQQPKYDALRLAICPHEREMLYDRINARVDIMLAEGLEAETAWLRDHGMLVGTAGQAIGYKEFSDYFDGTADLQTCADLIRQRSRNYAKRQLTWLRRTPHVRWLQYHTLEEFAEIVHNPTQFLQPSV